MSADFFDYNLSKWYDKMLFRVSIIVILAIFNIAMFHKMVWGPTGLLDYYSLKDEYNSIKDEIKNCDKKNVMISNEIRLLQNDRRYIESNIRQKLHYVKDNELIYLFEQPSKLTTGVTRNVRQN